MVRLLKSLPSHDTHTQNPNRVLIQSHFNEAKKNVILKVTPFLDARAIHSSTRFIDSPKPDFHHRYSEEREACRTEDARRQNHSNSNGR